MKIWVVMSGYEFDGDTPRAAFTDESKADAWLTQMSKKEKGPSFWVAEVALDPEELDGD